MSAKDTHLYGVARPKKLSGKEISSSSTLAFTSELSSLITTSKSSASNGTQKNAAPLAGRPRPAKKEDIFTKHNRNSRKRALADLQDGGDDGAMAQRHSTASGPLDEGAWRRARRKMEEKARLYAAMKRGDVEDEHERYAVDFDRKWADAQTNPDAREDSSEGEDEVDSEGEELVEYEDEFGRVRRGTRAAAELELRKRRARERGEEDTDRFTARPSAPSNIIRGDAVQVEAFNPDAQREQAMAELAAKRDRSLTPPPETHFDSRQEVRQKGQGFFAFSKDEEERRRQMANLEKEREETGRRRKETEDRKAARRREVEERRKIIQSKRGKAQADRFLDGLTAEMGEGTGVEQAEEVREEEHHEAPHAELPNAGSILRDKLDKLQDGGGVD